MSADEGFQHISERQRTEGRVVTGDVEQREPQLESSQAKGGTRKSLQADTGVGGVPQGRSGKCGWKWD